MHSSARATAPVPTGLARRWEALDILRGIAILGTLATNIGIFTASGIDWEGAEYAEPSWFADAMSTFLGLVTDGKFIGLLTIMFGIGLEIQRQSAKRRGETWLGSYPWRAALLVIDGLLNYLFIFEFDVLMGYGLTGLVMCAVFAASPRVQAVLAVVGIGAHLAHLWFLTNSNGLSFGPEPAYAEPVDLSAFDVNTYWGGVQYRAATFWEGRAEIPIMLTMGIGLYLIGAFLYRAGIFEARGQRLRRWIMALSFGIGLPLDWGTRLFTDGNWATYNRYLTSAMVSIGILALVAGFYANGRTPGRVGRNVALVGRMALTTYLAQNLIASVLMYPWGFGLARFIPLQHTVWWDMISWAAISLILIVLSRFWLARHARGPVEIAWRASHEWIMRHMPYERYPKRLAPPVPSGPPHPADPPTARARA